MFNEIFTRSNFFFSGYFRMSEDHVEDPFVYQNNSEETEILDAILFSCDGINDKKWKILSTVLLPGQSLSLGAKEVRSLLPGVKEGSILLCLKGPRFKDAVRLKDLMMNWSSKAGGSFFAIGPFSEVNPAATKAKKSFYMFCPLASRKNGTKNFNVFVNHSSDHEYTDTVELVPQLSNLNGAVIVGAPLRIPPFGTFVMDVEKYFGKAGVALLDKTDGYGGITVQHVGHILASYFFQADTEGNIVCGNHTQAAFGILGGPSFRGMFKDEIKRLFPFIVSLRTKVTR